MLRQDKALQIRSRYDTTQLTYPGENTPTSLRGSVTSPVCISPPKLIHIILLYIAIDIDIYVLLSSRHLAYADGEARAASLAAFFSALSSRRRSFALSLAAQISGANLKAYLLSFINFRKSQAASPW